MTHQSNRAELENTRDMYVAKYGSVYYLVYVPSPTVEHTIMVDRDKNKIKSLAERMRKWSKRTFEEAAIYGNWPV